ncbi:hypothetical protein JOC85_001049 [Bacillus mesophilus]|nr:hypothetical protein [Bacillus mesophilus]
MRKVIFLMLIGNSIFMTGVYISTLLTTYWVIIGTSLAVVGGIVMGLSSYFWSKPKNKFKL